MFQGLFEWGCYLTRLNTHTHTVYSIISLSWGVGDTRTYIPADIELQGQAWYHGWISQETAEERLHKVPYQCFLIRENGVNLSLSMKHQGEVSHFLLKKDSDGYALNGTDRKFDTLLQLVDFFMTNSITGDLRHYLSSPCPRPSPDGECNGDHDTWQVSGDSVPSFPALPLQFVLTMI